MERINKVKQHLVANPVSSPNPISTSNNQVGATASKYVYTADEENLLTKEMREQYDRDGFFVVKNCLSQETIDKYLAHFYHLVKNPKDRVPGMTVVRDVALVKSGVKKDAVVSEELITKFQDFVEDPEFFDFCCQPNVVKYARAIVGHGSGIQAMHTMLINKPPDLGKGTSQHPLHQDLWYFNFRPANKIAAAWCAMEDITEENGCLVVVPGTHKLPLYKHGYPEFDVNKAYHQILGVDMKGVKTVPLHMKKGDVVFFHPCLWHGSGPNFSSRTRKAISCHFASTDCLYYEVKGTIQQEIEDEVLDMAKNLLAAKGINQEMMKEMNFDLRTVWNIRSKVVIGDEPIANAPEGSKLPDL